MHPGVDLSADSRSTFPRISPKGLRLEMGSLAKAFNDNMLNALELLSRDILTAIPDYLISKRLVNISLF